MPSHPETGSATWELSVRGRGFQCRRGRQLPMTHADGVAFRFSAIKVQRNADGSTTLKLADFSLAMVVTEPIFTVCGTPTYVAPEILAEKGEGIWDPEYAGICSATVFIHSLSHIDTLLDHTFYL